MKLLDLAAEVLLKVRCLDLCVEAIKVCGFNKGKARPFSIQCMGFELIVVYGHSVHR